MIFFNSLAVLGFRYPKNLWGYGSSFVAPMSQPNKTTKFFDYLLDPEKRQEIESFVTQNITAYKAAFQRLDKSASLPTLFSSLWYSKLPCFDVKGITSEKLGEKSLLKLCQWKSMTIPCSAIFTTFPTDLGMCCTFNMKAADDIFQDKTYVKRLREQQEEDKKLSFENSQPLNGFWKLENQNLNLEYQRVCTSCWMHIMIWCQFHQRSMSSFYTHRSWKHKKDWRLDCIYAL